MASDAFYTAVDLGNSKIATIVARVGAEGELKVLGTGLVPSQGMRKGRIERIDELRVAVRSSLEEAQRYLGRGVTSRVYVGVSGTHLSCLNTKDVVQNPGNVKDISSHLLNQLIRSSIPDVRQNQEALHIIPIGYEVDGVSGIRNPVGLQAEQVHVEAHVVLGEAAALKNTVNAVEASRVTVQSLVMQSLASAEATLTGDERETGVVFVDIGAGTSDLIIYREGSPWYSAVIPMGGDQMTKDLSVALGTTVYLAEEIKVKWGHAIPDSVAGDDEVVIPSYQGQPRRVVPRRDISEPLQDRAVDILKQILLKARQAGLREFPPGGLVLTGGCAELPGFRDLAQKILGGPVRIAYPRGIAGLPVSLQKPTYSAGIGLLLWGIKHQGERRPYRRGERPRWGSGSRAQRSMHSRQPVEAG